jgi:ABC-2 type transport system ATP-binding protein
MQAATSAGVELEDIALRQPNLDEVFLALTGKPTEDHDPTTANAA